ncbi:MAG: heparinase [Gemmatimonadetes bacterium]|jgi:hypothetical protein|nr:heparinase [Gemmatimonadota bacterium]
MLTELYPVDKIGDVLIPREQYHPFPTADEREGWEELREAVRKAHIARGEAALGKDWPSLPATLFLEYARTGNRSRYQNVRNVRRNMLCDMVVAECMEGKGRFVDGITDGVWTTCEETYWGVPAHINAQRAGVGLPDVAEPTVDLFAGETVSLLAWTLYLVGSNLDEVSPLIRERIHIESDRRVLTPCLERDDFWWMGFGNRTVNNWNPWCNSNWLTATLLLERDQERRQAAVVKILRSLDRFVDPYPTDGGCDEGPGYWGRAGASLFDCLELLHGASDGAIDVYDRPLIQEMGRYIYRVQIADRYFVNFADAAALVSPSASLVFQYGQRIGDKKMMALGAEGAKGQNLFEKGAGDSIGRQLPALFALEELAAVEPAQPLPRDAWFSEIQVMAARDREGSAEGLYVAAKGGHNAESHNHNDIGHFIAYAGGKPVVVDAGVEDYTAKTFSSQRYEIWTMQSAYHSLPTIGGVMQEPGKAFAARDVEYETDDGGAQLRMDIAGAYPAVAGLKSWKRVVKLNRGRNIEVADAYELEHEAEISLSLITPCEVALEEDGVIELKEREIVEGRASGNARIYYPANMMKVAVEEVPVEDSRLQSIWGERLFRMVLRLDEPTQEGAWKLRLET